MKIPDVLDSEIRALEQSRAREASRALSPEYLVASGESLQFSGFYEEAIAKYEAACDLEPRNSRYLVRLGQAYVASYDLTNAERVLREAIRAAPTCSLALDALGQVLLDEGIYDEARECYEKLIEMFPHLQAYYYRLAVALTELGRPEDAADYLSRAATQEHIRAGVYYDLAWTAMRAS
ncbi:MAG: tetratricopeptide repeat protein [Planctomycetota bacterium]|jgi:superkiller protein 3